MMRRNFQLFLTLLAFNVILFMVLTAVPPSTAREIIGYALASTATINALHGLGLAVWAGVSGAVAFWKKPSPRLNGWQRMGIVASVLWALGAFLHVSGQENLASKGYRLCLEVRKGEFDACSKELREYYPIAAALKHQEALVSALVPPVLGWLLAWIVIGTVRWVREGFHRVQP